MKIEKGKFKIAGGVHPGYFKDLSRDKAIGALPMPEILRVSMSQHLGAPAIPVVKKGDAVLKGQVIGESGGFISAQVHAPTSGAVSAVESAVTPMGTQAQAVCITPNGDDQWVEGLTPCPDWKATDVKELVERVADAGIAGMGGAGFPTHVKLSPPPGKTIDTLIINGAECEPYLTADHRIMIEHAREVAEGALIIRKILGANVLRVAIEDNKPEAIEAKQQALAGAQGDIAVSVLPTEYPHGAEKQQIFVVTGREVPSGGLPMDVQCVVENVGTAMAVWDAVVNGRPLIERITTVTGSPVSNPCNVRAPIGTPYADLLTFAGGTTGDVAKVISGGPMMGLALAGLDVATSKTTSGLLLLDPADVQNFTSMPCISCGRCVEACPMNLMPAELSQMLEAEDFDAAEEYCVLDCIECGCCAFACPAHRPLVQHMKQGKAAVNLKRRQAKG